MCPMALFRRKQRRHPAPVAGMICFGKAIRPTGDGANVRLRGRGVKFGASAK
jgi:hypothetical protein